MRIKENIYMAVGCSPVFYCVDMAVDEQLGSEIHSSHGYSVACGSVYAACRGIPGCAAADRAVTIGSQRKVSEIGGIVGIAAAAGLAFILVFIIITG